MNSAQAAIECAETLLAQRNVLAAHKQFYLAERLGADADHCSGGRWLADMFAGDFTAAWFEADAIRARGTPDEHRFWNGKDITRKRVIVRSLHGFGDAVQMLRFAPLLAARAARVTYEVAPPFVELARCFPGVEEVVTWGDAAPATAPVWDVQVEVMEIPYLLRLQCAQLPFARGYVQVPTAELQRIGGNLGVSDRPRVGVVWSCGEWNLTRRLPPECLTPLLAVETVEFWSLESAKHSEQSRGLGLRDASTVCGDGLLALAATIAQLDLVITVDTLAAHLAGALGTPVWLLLQHAADWRWMLERTDSPWYPTMRLFRQPRAGDWESAVSTVTDALKRLF